MRIVDPDRSSSRTSKPNCFAKSCAESFDNGSMTGRPSVSFFAIPKIAPPRIIGAFLGVRPVIAASHEPSVHAAVGLFVESEYATMVWIFDAAE